MPLLNIPRQTIFYTGIYKKGKFITRPQQPSSFFCKINTIQHILHGAEKNNLYTHNIITS